MAKGRIVDNTVKLLIASLYREHPDWPAKMIKDAVNRHLGQDWPGLSVVQKELSKIKERFVLDNPQEKPWNTDSLNSCPIPPSALPVVLKVWKFHIEKGEGFTIREAKWVSRLSALEQDTGKLSFIATRHARVELMYEIIGQPFDSTDLDRLLMGLPVALTTPRALLPFLAEQDDGLEQIRDLAKGKSKKLHIHKTGTAGTVEFHEGKREERK